MQIMSYDIVVKDGLVITPERTTKADVAISGEKIAAVETNLEGKVIVDARDMFVIPGAIDPHVHLEMPVGATQSSDTWATGTIAAACGGTTTVLDFVEPGPDEPLLHALDARRMTAEGQAVIDYGLHMTITQADTRTLNQIPNIIEAGCSSFKTYLTYEGFRLEDEQYLAVSEAVARYGGLLLTHAENDAMIEYRTRQLLLQGNTGPQFHPLSRPAIAEAEAITRALALAEITGVHLYIVHISTSEGAEALKRARQRGAAVYGETCPQYLLLTETEYQRPGFEAAKYVCSPPLRSARDCAHLWGLLANGDLDTVGTDHCPFNFDGQKDMGRESFDQIPGGLPGIEARLPLIYNFGVQRDRLTLERWVDICCTAPARLFKLYPRKGSIIPGGDADIVVFDPSLEVTLSSSMLHEQVDYTPYEGMRVSGYPVVTISRGTIVYMERAFTGPEDHGQYLKR